MMRKGFAFMFGIFMVFSMTACGMETSGAEGTETFRSSSPIMTVEETVDTEPETAESIKAAEEENGGRLFVRFGRK